MTTLKRHFLNPQVFGLAIAALVGTTAITASLNSCATINALAGLTRIQFKLNNVSNVRVAGIDVANKHSISDFSIMDGVSLMQAFTSGRFPLTFTLNMDAHNPNSGNAAYNSIKLTSFPWRLLLDNHETISGAIGAPVGIPAAGMTSTIPLEMSVDLKQFFANNSYNDMLNLVLALSGQGGASHVQLKATPTISTPLGSLRYPGELTIVNTEFRS